MPTLLLALSASAASFLTFSAADDAHATVRCVESAHEVFTGTRCIENSTRLVHTALSIVHVVPVEYCKLLSNTL